MAPKRRPDGDGAPCRITVHKENCPDGSPCGFGVISGRGIVSHRIKTKADAQRAFDAGLVSAENLAEVLPLLPAGQSGDHPTENLPKPVRKVGR